MAKVARERSAKQNETNVGIEEIVECEEGTEIGCPGQWSLEEQN